MLRCKTFTATFPASCSPVGGRASGIGGKKLPELSRTWYAHPSLVAALTNNVVLARTRGPISTGVQLRAGIPTFSLLGFVQPRVPLLLALLRCTGGQAFWSAFFAWLHGRSRGLLCSTSARTQPAVCCACTQRVTVLRHQQPPFPHPGGCLGDGHQRHRDGRKVSP